MKQSAARIRSLLLLTAAALAVLVLLLWSGGGEQTARAYPGLTVAIDMDPSTTTDTNGDGVYDLSEGVDIDTFESCIDVTNGEQFDVVVSVLDVLDLTAFLADIEYDGSVVKIIGAYTGTTPSNTPTMFMSTQPLSDVQNESQNDPAPSTGDLWTEDIDGSYEAAAFDASHTDTGDDGSGILVRLTLEATAVGVSPLNIDTEDIDGDGIQDRGVMLRDVNAVILNDSNGDGFFDGPFLNTSANIAVDQPDSNDNGISDICDPDMDGDGYCNPGLVHPSCTGSDNCPTISNPTQSDIDGDGLGDPCDTWDADGDGYTNTEETTYASDTLDPLSTPEVCDGTDSDGDTLTDEGFDYSRPNSGIPSSGPPNGIPDCTEDVHSDDDGTANPSDDDDDNDGTSDANENIIATDSLVACDNGSGLPDLPPDFDDNTTINLGDVFNVTPPYFGASLGDDEFRNRIDLTPDSVINLADVFGVLPPIFGTSCTP